MLSAKSIFKIAVSGTVVVEGVINADTLEKRPIIIKNDNTLPTMTANNPARNILPNDVFTTFTGFFFATRFVGSAGAFSALGSAGATSALGSALGSTAGVASAAFSVSGSASATPCSATFCSLGVGSVF